MTRIEFIYNVKNKMEKSAELCEKALLKGHKLTIITQNETMSREVQNLLWQYSATSFLPNNMGNDIYANFSPILIHETSLNFLQDDVLINLQMEPPTFYGRFRYLVELVGCDDEDKVAARARFRFYKERGYEIKSTDSNEKK